MRKGLASVGLALAALAAWGGATTAAAQSPDQNRAMFAVMVNQVMNDGNLGLVDDIVASDVTSNGEPVGREGFKAMVQQLRAGAPGYHATVEDVATQDDKVIGRISETGAAPDSRIIVLRIVDGTVKEYWTFNDEPALRKQFGLGGSAAAPSTNSY
ncbi:MAG TPA: ester cyclase [Gemmatimonadales bacterium]|nr:ester cyclase [Gemmatimonadales bacterium]